MNTDFPACVGNTCTWICKQNLQAEIWHTDIPLCKVSATIKPRAGLTVIVLLLVCYFDSHEVGECWSF